MLFEKVILCIECKFKQDERRIRKIKTNIHVDFMRSNIMLFDDAINSLSERKIELIKQDCTLDIDMLFVINTSLIIDEIKRILRFNIILAIRR